MMNALAAKTGSRPEATSVPLNLKEVFMHRLALAAGALTIAVLAFPTSAGADAVYHSQHIPLAPLGDASLRSGFVENIHASGPNVFAHEVYVVNGAAADTEFQVSIALFVQDPTCTSSPTVIPTATLATNGAGNGKAQAFFTPEDAAALRHASHGAIWQLSVNGVVQYQTACSTIVLD
jgi:hypothetical protein